MSLEDQQEMEDKDTARELWEALETKYKETLTTHARQYLKQYVNFEVTGTIDEAWSQIHTLARRIVTIRPELGVLDKPSERIQILLSALPEAYSSLVDSIDGQLNLNPPQILARLQEKEAQVGPVQPVEKAMATKLKRGPSCFLCQKKHGVLNCPWLETCQKLIKQKEKEREKELQEQEESSSFESEASDEDMRALKKNLLRLSAQVDKMKGDLGSKKKGKASDRAYISIQDYTPECFNHHGLKEIDQSIKLDLETGTDCHACGLRVPQKIMPSTLQ